MSVLEMIHCKAQLDLIRREIVEQVRKLPELSEELRALLIADETATESLTLLMKQYQGEKR